MEDYLQKLNYKIDRYKSKYARSPKKAALKLAFWNLCYWFKSLGHKPKISKRTSDTKALRLCFRIFGGLGDTIIAYNYIQNLSRYLDMSLDIAIVGKNARLNYLFSEYTILREFTCNEDFDIVISLVRFPRIEYMNNQRQFPEKWLTLSKTYNDFYEHNSKLFNNCPENDGVGNCIAEIMGKRRFQQPDIGNILNLDLTNEIRLSVSVNEKQILQKFGLEKRKFVTINRDCEGFEANFECTKMWPLENYEAYIESLKQRFPKVCFVQVGVKCKRIQSVDLDLIGRTSLEELKVILKHAVVHIGNEGGLIHMRHFLGAGPSIVLFGPTSANVYGYPENLNLRKTTCPHCCEWLNNQWLSYCIKSQSSHSVCMRQLTPKFVFEKSVPLLENQVYE